MKTTAEYPWLIVETHLASSPNDDVVVRQEVGLAFRTRDEAQAHVDAQRVAQPGWPARNDDESRSASIEWRPDLGYPVDGDDTALRPQTRIATVLDRLQKSPELEDTLSESQRICLRNALNELDSVTARTVDGSTPQIP